MFVYSSGKSALSNGKKYGDVKLNKSLSSTATDVLGFYDSGKLQKIQTVYPETKQIDVSALCIGIHRQIHAVETVIREKCRARHITHGEIDAPEEMVAINPAEFSKEFSFTEPFILRDADLLVIYDPKGRGDAQWSVRFSNPNKYWELMRYLENGLGITESKKQEAKEKRHQKRLHEEREASTKLHALEDPVTLEYILRTAEERELLEFYGHCKGGDNAESHKISRDEQVKTIHDIIVKKLQKLEEGEELQIYKSTPDYDITFKRSEYVIHNGKLWVSGDVVEGLRESLPANQELLEKIKKPKLPALERS